MQSDEPIQLDLLPSYLEGLREERHIVGLWSGGERWVSSHGRVVNAHAWFHFRQSGEACLIVRTDQQREPHRVHGRWWTEGHELVCDLGGGIIRSHYTVHHGVLRWADEVLVTCRPQQEPDKAAPEVLSASSESDYASYSLVYVD